MNKVILMGRLTRDPDYRSGETNIARFNIAVDRRGKNQEQSADFISCVAFGKSADFAENYLKKGTKIALEGRLTTGSYTNKDGVKVYTTDVIVDAMEFAESKASSNNNNNAGANAGIESQFMSIPDGVEDEGLPFN